MTHSVYIELGSQHAIAVPTQPACACIGPRQLAPAAFAPVCIAPTLNPPHRTSIRQPALNPKPYSPPSPQVNITGWRVGWTFSAGEVLRSPTDLFNPGQQLLTPLNASRVEVQVCLPSAGLS